ncbi:MAG: creatininase family protein [Chloroflexi bacterium]|nr:creatininase family protein [Chloroflexota bacterium]
MRSPGKPILWEELTWPEAERIARKRRLALIPCGATEQHGPHLPLAVDWMCTYEVACRASAATGVPVVHPLVFGLSAGHGSFPGTIGLRPQTMLALLEDLSDSLYRSGIRDFVFLNGHAWNSGPLISIRELLQTRYADVRIRLINWWELVVSPELKSTADAPEGGRLVHANFGETSTMLALRPDLVRMSRAVNQDDHNYFWDYRADQVTATGVVGRKATAATAEAGKGRLVEAASALIRLLHRGLREPRLNVRRHRRRAEQ